MTAPAHEPRGMKERELRESATCAACQRKLGRTEMPLLFYRVRIERFGIKADAVERQQGLAMMLGGNGLLASVMGADEDMAVEVMDPVTVTICEGCSTRPVLVAALVERGAS